MEGVEFEHYNQSQQKILKTWEIKINEKTYRVVLEKDTLNIYLNGDLREEKAEFVDNGTETRFEADDNSFVLCAKMSSDHSGVFYELLLNGVVQEVPEIQ